jgi:uncharacterized membrane protein YdfJ with MMPL/SSD domain
MFTSLARLAVARPRRVAALGLAFLLLAGVIGGPAAGKLDAPNAFLAPGSPSYAANQTIERVTGAEAFPGVLALVPAGPSSPRVATVAREIGGVPGVAGVRAPSAAHPDGLVARDGREVVLAVSLRAHAKAAAVIGAITDAVPRDVLLGGADVAGQQVGSQATKDLGLAELIAFPLLLILSLLIFRGVAALLPLAVGGVSVLGTFFVLAIVNTQLSLSSFALNLVIGVGLGLAVDYSLLLVWRFREELSQGEDVEAALITTLNTAGRAVSFSALTVAASLATLILFPQRFLISMGVGGAAVALVAGLATLLVLPSLLVLLAPRIAKVAPEPAATGRFYRLAHGVMKRPVLVAGLTTALLLAIASPTLAVRWSGVDATILPTSQSARVVQDQMAAQFPDQDLNQIVITARAPASSGAPVAAYARRVAAVPGVSATGAPRYLGADTWELTLGAQGDPISVPAQRTYTAVEALDAPFRVQIDGTAAQFHDQKVAITRHLAPALVILVLITLILLWLMTGSVVLPLKALVMNALTAATATGVLVFVFQHGRLTGLLDYTSQGGIEQTDFLVLVAVAFALSTDYGVLLLSRIKEARDRGAENREAIALGLQRTGRIVSATALLKAVAIGAFATSHVVFLKEIGIGAVVAVLVDAFLIRCTLVPALMVLLGEWNWWSPRPLARLHRRIGISETPGPAPDGIGQTAATLVSLPVGE